MTARHQLDARSGLRALSVLGCTYAPDTAVVDGAWIATCPNCHTPRSLRLRELRERDDAHRDPPISIGCQRRCAAPAELAALLATDVAVLDERAVSARWRAVAIWAIEFAQRQLDLDSGVTI